MSTYTLITGYYDTQKNHWRGANLDNWAALTSWSTWTSWVSNPSTVSLQIDDDLASTEVRIATLELSYIGTRTVQLKTSDTGLFAGEETTINFVAGTNYGIPSARYYRWTITATGTLADPIPYIRNAVPTYSTAGFTTEIYRNIVTSTLSGTVNARVVPTTSGTIHSVNITSLDSTNYVDRAYSVPDTFSVSTISPVPGIVSKAPLTIVLRDYYGVPVDGIVDITVRGSPSVSLELDGGVIIS